MKEKGLLIYFVFLAHFLPCTTCDRGVFFFFLSAKQRSALMNWVQAMPHVPQMWNSDMEGRAGGVTTVSCYLLQGLNFLYSPLVDLSPMNLF